jgi:hypothetical protein
MRCLVSPIELADNSFQSLAIAKQLISADWRLLAKRNIIEFIYPYPGEFIYPLVAADQSALYAAR